MMMAVSWKRKGVRRGPTRSDDNGDNDTVIMNGGQHTRRERERERENRMKRRREKEDGQGRHMIGGDQNDPFMSHERTAIGRPTHSEAYRRAHTYARNPLQ